MCESMGRCGDQEEERAHRQYRQARDGKEHDKEGADVEDRVESTGGEGGWPAIDAGRVYPPGA